MTFEEWWNTKDYPDCCLLRCKRAFNEGRAELEQENAELKEELKGKRCNCMTYLNFKDLEKQLTKANLLLEDVYKIAMEDWNDPKWHDQVLQKAREYLKEIEK